MTSFFMRSIAVGAVALGFSMAVAPADAAKGDRVAVTATASEAQVRSTIEQILTSPERLPGHLERVRKELTQHYVTNQGAIYWIGTRRMTPFIQRLEFAGDDGLEKADYHVDYLLTLRDSLRAGTAGDPVAAAFAELTFSTFFHRYASDLLTGRFVPQKIDPNLFQPKRHLSATRVFAGYANNPDPNNYLDTYQPRVRHYAGLKELLVRYNRIAAKGGWIPVKSGPTLRPGADDPRIPSIRQRLIQSGDLPESAASNSTVYDNQLAEAMKRFQRRHGLNDEGIIGKLSLVQFNTPARERVRQIIVNMERWRWMPQDMGKRHIMVNIAGFELERVDNNKVVERVPVMVGKVYHQTPVFSDEIEYVEFNPTWTVPYSIATKEMLPKLKANPTYLGPHFQLLQGGQSIPFTSVDFSQYNQSNFPFTIRQMPNDKNALGRVKFMLPNKHAVYLHDTPSRSLFSRTERAFSHGCVRVYDPLNFATKVLSDLPGYNRRKVNAIVASRELTRVSLPKHIPVHLVYATAWRSPEGEVHFRPDIYGRDRKLYWALFAKKTS